MAKSPAKTTRKRLTVVQRVERDAKLRKLDKLRRLGLVETKYKKPTPYTDKILKKFAGVLSGKDKIIETGDAKAAAKYKGQKVSGKAVQVVGDKIIVPKQKGKQIKWSKKKQELTGTIRKTKLEPSKRVTFIKATPANINKFRGRSDVTFILPIVYGSHVQRRRYSAIEQKHGNDIDELLRVLSGYETKEHNPWATIRDYIEIEYE